MYEKDTGTAIDSLDLFQELVVDKKETEWRDRTDSPLLSSVSEVSLDCVDELLIFSVGQIDLAWVHLEGSAVIWTIDILGCQVEV